MDAAEHVEGLDGERTESVLQNYLSGQGDDLGDGVADLEGVEVLAGETPEGPGQDALLRWLLVLDTAQSWRGRMRETTKIIISQVSPQLRIVHSYVCSPESPSVLYFSIFSLQRIAS